jgi:ankyrin repeat protein
VDINVRGAQMRTPLHRSVGKGNNDVVKLLVDKGADLSMVDSGGLSPLHWAALFGLVQSAELIVVGGAHLDMQSKSGETPLHLAAEKGHVPFVKFLLAHGASSLVTDNGNDGGATAFVAAKKNGHKEVMVILKPVNHGCCEIM